MQARMKIFKNKITDSFARRRIMLELKEYKGIMNANKNEKKFLTYSLANYVEMEGPNGLGT